MKVRPIGQNGFAMDLFCACTVLAFVICLCFAVTGCATPGPKVVDVPVAVRCDPKLKPKPVYPDTDEALQQAPDIFAATQLYVAGRLLRIAREGELEAALTGCTGAR